MPNVLTPLQLQLLHLLFEKPEISEPFFLSGGCALSWGYLEHRRSKDLDLFSRESVNLEDLDRTLERLLSSHGMRLSKIRSSSTFRRFQVETVTETTLLDFVTEDPTEIASPNIKDEVRLDSLIDIAVNKVIALDRTEAKDAVDLFLLLRDRGFSIFDLMEKAKQKTMDAEEDTYPLRVARLLESAGKLPNFAKLQLIVQIDQDEMSEFLAQQAGQIYEQFR